MTGKEMKIADILAGGTQHCRYMVLFQRPDDGEDVYHGERYSELRRAQNRAAELNRHNCKAMICAILE